ncbi:MAG: hypothetical protein ABIA93_03910 [Candidatus Woesearchaeota archaeon]
MKTWILLIIAMFVLSACEFIASDDEINAAVKAGDASMCDNLDTSNNAKRIDRCYSEVGSKTNDVSTCEKISDSSYMSQCYEHVAVNTGKEELCSKVNAQVNRRECYSGIAVKKKDMSICTSLNEDIKDGCIQEYAIGADDFDACSQIMPKSGWEDDCYMHFAIARKNENICPEINSAKEKDNCYYEIAKLTNGNLLCDKIENKDTKGRCVMDMARSMENELECNRLDPDSYYWDKCVTQVAVLKKDVATCTMLEVGSEAMKSCELQVNNAIVQSTASS